MGLLDWLGNFFSSAAQTIGSATANVVNWAIHGVTSVFLSTFKAVVGAWNILYGDTKYFGLQMARFADAVYNQFMYTLKVRIPALFNWAAASLARLWNLIKGIAKQLYHDVLWLVARIAAGLNALKNWVLQHVWAPLDAFITQTWRDLLKWGYTAWWWITHLAALAEAMIFHIAAAMEKYAWQLAGILGKFVLSLILANAKRIAVLVEDLVTAVF